MGKRRKRRDSGLPLVNEADFIVGGECGPITYHMPMPPIKSYLRWGPGGKLELYDPPPKPSPAPLVPASEEVAKLPRTAREAFAARCAARVAPLRAGATSPEAVAALLLAAATVETPIRRQLLCVRRDFDLIARLSAEGNWTDDAPVPADAFGPLWPKNLTPVWAKPPDASAPPAGIS